MKINLAVLFLLYLNYANADTLNLGSVRDRRKISNPNDKRIVCYYANWAVYRQGDSKFTPEDIHPHLCTHVLYAFATLEKDVGLVPFDPKQDIQLEGYAKFIDLKKANLDLKLILSVGGTKEGPARFSKIAADPVLRSQFAKNGRVFLEQFKFDGLDLVWQYPALAEGSSSSDKENYVLLVKELRNEFKDDFVISVAVPALEYLITGGFNLPELSKYVDFMNVLTYNYHEATEPEVNHVAPLYFIPQDTDKTKQLNIDYTIRTYMSLGMDPAKLNLGIPLYGASFILEDPLETDIGSATEDEGPGSQERGAVVYNNFCKMIKEELWTVRHVNKSAVGPYAYKDKRWVSYDDEDMIRTKARYANEKKLGGLMFWTIDMDDFKGICHPRAFPLIKAGRETFFSKPRTSTTATPTMRPTRPTLPSTESTTPAVIALNDNTHGRGTTTQPRTRPTQYSPRPISPSTLPEPNHSQKPVYIKPTDDTPIFPFVKNELPNESFTDSFPDIKGQKVFHSNRDIVFQNIKVWVNNHYYAPGQQKR